METILPEGIWGQLFAGLDLPVIVMIGALAFVLHRAAKLSELWAVGIPLALGTLWGLLSALQASAQISGQPYAMPALIFKGVLMNGGGATVLGRVVSIALSKTGLWAPTEAAQVAALTAKVVEAPPAVQAQVKQAITP